VPGHLSADWFGDCLQAALWLRQGLIPANLTLADSSRARDGMASAMSGSSVACRPLLSSPAAAEQQRSGPSRPVGPTASTPSNTTDLFRLPNYSMNFASRYFDALFEIRCSYPAAFLFRIGRCSGHVRVAVAVSHRRRHAFSDDLLFDPDPQGGNVAPGCTTSGCTARLDGASELRRYVCGARRCLRDRSRATGVDECAEVASADDATIAMCRCCATQN
jgi:hypothetical protein